MGGFGSIWHWVIVLLVIVLLFGAKKIPELAKGLGSGIKNFKKAVKDDEEEPIQEEEEEKPKPKKVESSKKKSSVNKQETSQKPQ
ncbi:twin-arginine translocase TatA/TatE family subunit [Helicobacter mustelae]|uniref:Sec-independent protein translocase protein TatA n=1 Tax=Helicobacter mustelae (strain ATCC 43772 / CCUG 25715 / CIP 103759 / LMG 18044 / NCTC 12198 / R85-136P) TaxID=679897 RepID=D3UG70_HELM1|nr:twin-arginine translocase TatA/TatE family subunit [Helicobacter mustelae]CBG39491.1 putative Sec-independent protein translocase component [Helicobacter mustelae 12198]SQH71003.1 Sec-independent protein translocase component [Helicobacter mustelae]